MWFRIELHKDNSVASCEQVAESRHEGRAVHYVEAPSKQEAIRILLARYDRNNQLRREATLARTERFKAEGLCRKCGKTKCSEGLTHCQVCLDAKRSRRAEVKAGALVISTAAYTPEQKIQAQLNRQAKDCAKASQKAGGHYIMVRVAYARCLEAFDAMTPTAYRMWLSEELHKAQQKEAASAAKRSAAWFAKQARRRKPAAAAA